MASRSRLVLVAAAAVAVASGATACSTEQATTLATELQQLFSGDEVASAPASCLTAFQADEDFETLLCTSDCVDWLRSVLDEGACDSEQLEAVLAEVSGYVTQCQARRLRFANAQELDREPVEEKRRLRQQNDAQMGSGKPRLSVKGLMDAILVLTLNNAL